MGKRTSFIVNLFLALFGVLILGVGQITASANTNSDVLSSITNVWVLVGILILLIAFWWFLRSSGNEKTPSGKMEIEDFVVESEKEKTETDQKIK